MTTSLLPTDIKSIKRAVDNYLIADNVKQTDIKLQQLERATAQRIAPILKRQGIITLREFERLEGIFQEKAENTNLDTAFGIAQIDTRQAFIDSLTGPMSIAASLGGQTLSTQLGIKLSFNPVDPKVHAYLQERAAESVTGIDDTTRARLHTIVEKGYGEGKTYQQIARDLKKDFAEYSLPGGGQRAKLIAVTELGNAHEATKETMTRQIAQAGFKMKKFALTLKDEKVCSICRMNMADGWIPIDQPHSSGHQRSKFHPGCRCPELYRADLPDVAGPQGDFALKVDMVESDRGAQIITIEEAEKIEYAQLDSPQLTGKPTAPTPPEEDESERIATTEYIKRALDTYPKCIPDKGNRGQILAKKTVLDYDTEWVDIPIIAVGGGGGSGGVGPQGPAGPAGADGLPGADGTDGAPGAQGPQGIQGLPGANGADGTDGVDGAPGAQGIQGEIGPQGLQGDIGPQGPQGIQGIQGPAGADGIPTTVTDTSTINLTLTGHDLSADVLVVPATSVELAELGTATYDDLQDYINSTVSGGRITGGDLTAHAPANGTLDISALKGFIKSTNSEIALTKFFDLAAQSGIALTDNSINYIYVDYNSGTPQVLVTTDRTSIRWTDQFNLGRAFRQGNDVEVLTSGINLYNHRRRTHERWIDTFGGLSYASGINLSFTGLKPAITGGVMYAGNNRITIDPLDCNAGGTFASYYYNPTTAAWVETDGLSSIDVTNYNKTDTGTGLAALTANKYGIYWVYVCPDGDIYFLYGKGDYNLAQAQAATVATPIPNYLSQWAKLAAKVIFQKSAAAVYSVTMAWTTSFPVQQPGDHGDLAGLGDDDHSQYAYQSTIAPGTDLDTIIRPGMYYCLSEAGKNYPVAAGVQSALYVTVKDATHKTQHFFPGIASFPYIRIYLTDHWSAWYQGAEYGGNGVALTAAHSDHSHSDIPTSYLDTDETLAANSDSKIATQKATKAYVDNNSGVLPHPTVITTTTASKGGVFNGDFELIPPFTAPTTTNSRWIDGTAAGSTTIDTYGWYLIVDNANVGVSFDPSVSYSGKGSLKISLNATGTAGVTNSSGTSVPLMSKYCPVIKPNTKYRLLLRVKTNNVSIDGIYASFRQYSNDGTNLSTITTTKISGTNDWTNITTDFTSEATANWLYLFLHSYVAGNVSDAWFDDIRLEEVIEDTGYTGTIPTPLLSTITGVTSTGIDQSLDPTFAATYHYDLTNAVNEGATHRQTFTPTKNHVYSIKVKVIAKGTGNWTMVVHDASNVVKYSYLIANAALANNTITEFITAGLWDSGALHFHLYSSVADGTVVVGTADHDLETCSFIQYYAKPTENYTQVCNGDKISLSADSDGILGGAIIDLDKGKYLYDSLPINLNSVAFANNIYYATPGADTTATKYINGWRGNDIIASKFDSTERYFVIKVNTLLPIKHLSLLPQIYSFEAVDKSFQISVDNVNWTTLWIINTTTDALYKSLCETEIANGLTTFYVRVYKGAVSDYLAMYRLSIEADLDTSALPIPQIYPLSTNQFSDEVILPSVATRVYFRLNKFSNPQGVVVPHLEFTDASAVYIKAIPIRIDNSQETNPAVAIVKADTLYGQASGTGSDESGNYILNDGEYMTLSTATAVPRVTYQVGKGTTAFTNITKNVIYLSSNGSSNDSTKDPSHQMSVTHWYRLQSLAKTVNDVVRKVSNMAVQLIPSTLWQTWTPVLTWTTANPATPVITARYKTIGNLCYFAVFVTSGDSNGCTGLEITLPVPTTGIITFPCSNLIQNDTTYSSISSYVSAAQGIKFKNFPTCSDGKTVNVWVSGFYEILV